MLSERAKSYLSEFEREPAIIDEANIIAALNATNAPIFQPILHFQMEYGGYVEPYGLMDIRWGISHHKPDPNSFFEPDKIDFFFEDDEYYFTCANCHGSDHWTLDSKGMLYWCGFHKASSFEMKLEREAFGVELGMAGKVSPIRFEIPDKEVTSLLVPQLRNAIVEEISDKYQAYYLKDGLYAKTDFTDDSVLAWIVGDETPEMIKNIPFRHGYY